MTMNMAPDYPTFKPVKNNTAMWLRLLSGEPHLYHFNKNGHQQANGTNGLETVQLDHLQSPARFWLRLLGGAGSNNYHHPVSGQLSAVDLNAGLWLKILGGK